MNRRAPSSPLRRLGSISRGTLMVGAVLLAAVASAPSAPAAVFNVISTSDYGDANPGDGTCANQFGNCGLRAAIEEANELAGADTINLPAVNFVVGSELLIESDITIVGAGSVSTSISGNDATRVMRVTSSGDLTMSLLTLKDGNTSGDGGNLSVSGQASLSYCWIQGGYAADDGGGIAVPYYLGDLVLTGCWVLQNEAADSGGGIFASSGSSVTLYQGSVVDGNWAYGYGGGGIYSSQSTITVNNSSVTNNHAHITTGRGGGVMTTNAQLNLVYGTIDGNYAWEGGGVLCMTGGRVVATESTISNNEAGKDGGGLYLAGGGSSTMVNSTISGNTADEDGGGIFMIDSITDLQLSSVTVTDNTADLDGDNDGNGGGFYHPAAYQSELEARNTIIAGNHDECAGGLCTFSPECLGELVSDGYNIIGLDGAGCDIIGDTTGNQVSYSGQLDPGLGPLTDEGIYPTDFHQLLDTSIAVEAGNPAGCQDHNGTVLHHDQRGEYRPVGSSCDVGSYEHPDPVAAPIFSDGFESGDTSAWSL